LLETGATLKELRDIDERHLEAVYALAYNQYEQGKYDDAEKTFRFLCLLDHASLRYWKGYAATLQMMKRYDAAAKAYSQCARMEPEDPMPPLHAGECYLAVGNLELADAALSACVLWCADRPEHANTRARAEALLKVVEKRRAKNKEAG
jgi:type III secretion system low calcium response chaperone LcrH/SycD